MNKKTIIITVIILLILLNMIFPFFFSGLFMPLFNLKNKGTTEVVISHYKEDLSWIDKFIPRHFKIYIYTKSNLKPNCKSKYIHEYLKNVGRCDHTYAYHISKKYKKRDFCNNIIFLPGSCDLLYPYPKRFYLFLILLNVGNFNFFNPNLNYHFYPKITNYLLNKDAKNGYCSAHKNNVHKDCSLKKYKFNNIKEWMEHFKIDNIKYITFTGCFVIKSNIIYRREKEYYDDIINHMNYADSTLNGHFLERSWYSIFHP